MRSVLKFMVSFLAGLFVAVDVMGNVIVEKGTSKSVRSGASGELVYAVNAKGDRLPDFSYVGYYSGERPLPVVPVRMTVSPVAGDNTEPLQDAIDALAKLPPDAHGFCGALLLKRGIYSIEGSLRVKHSGVVLRGEGNGPDGTVVVAAGYGEGKDKRTLITVGDSSRVKVLQDSKRKITQSYVPVGTRTLTVESVDGFKVGDRIVVYRPSTAKWISDIGCDRLASRWELRQGKRVDRTVQWKPGAYDFYFEREIVAISGVDIKINAPLVHALDEKYGGGAVFRYETPGRVVNVGIENLRIMSEFGDPIKGHPYGDPRLTGASEMHGWNAIKLNRNSENTWVRNVTAKYFGWSVVSASGRRATVQDCVSLGHASRIAGGRRYPFMIDGQMNLVQRCITFEGRHEFVSQARTAGPNVFVDCIGFNSKSSAGPHHRYSVGTLFDNVKSEKYMESRFRGNSGTGHGWAGTQTCFYNCIAPGFNVKAPPGGISWVIGCDRAFSPDVRVSPASLYYRQVVERLGNDAVDYLVSPKQRETLGRYRWVKKRLAVEQATKAD